MTVLECNELVTRYTEWLRSGVSAQATASGCCITTPFVDRHRDFLQIYVERSPSGKVTLSDDGYMMRDLKISGFELEGERREDAVTTILRSFGVELRGDELAVEATPQNFAQKKHNLIQAMLAVGDLVSLAQPTIAALFIDDVTRYLEANQVRAAPKLKIVGESGLDQSFDFVIPRSNGTPERLLKAVATPNRANIVELMFAWRDVRSTRLEGTVAFAIINDQERKMNPELTGALNSYEITSVLWSERERVVEQFRK
ncbi:MAG: DUF1829 domain-containing protein [Dehalococcoidia bacterium]|nr:DUF1829 domain-containing protein [Dehalococcoidia bacterium]